MHPSLAKVGNPSPQYFFVLIFITEKCNSTGQVSTRRKHKGGVPCLKAEMLYDGRHGLLFGP